MFEIHEAILVLILIAGTASGTYFICRSKYHKLGYQFGVSSTIEQLSGEGFLEIEKDKDGEDSLVSIKEVKSRVRLHK